MKRSFSIIIVIVFFAITVSTVLAEPKVVSQKNIVISGVISNVSIYPAASIAAVSLVKIIFADGRVVILRGFPLGARFVEGKKNTITYNEEFYFQSVKVE